MSDAKKKGGVHIVTPDWLWACAERWEKVDERLYPLGQSPLTFRQTPSASLHRFDADFSLSEFFHYSCYVLTKNIV